MKRWICFGAVGLFAVVVFACESVVGDLSGYTALPKECHPARSTTGAPEFLNCSATQKCARGSSGFTCVTSSGALQRGAACSVETVCGPKLNCVSGVCTSYCDDKAPCPDGEACKPTGTAVLGTSLSVCGKTNCNPFDATDDTPPFAACNAGVECHFVDATSIQCGQVGTSPESGACTLSRVCGPNLFCIFYKNDAGTSNGFCRWPCRTELGDQDCASRAKKTCVATTTPFVVDGVSYGYCF